MAVKQVVCKDRMENMAVANAAFMTLRSLMERVDPLVAGSAM